MGRGGRDHHRGDRPGKTSGDPGISLYSFRGAGGDGAPIPPRGLVAEADTNVFREIAAMTPDRAATTEAPLLEVRGLTRRFGGVVALDWLDLQLRRGGILGLIGPNRSGKTTFFNRP